MNSIAHFLLQYAPFKWFTVADSHDKVVDSFTGVLYIQFSVILLCIICFIFYEYQKNYNTVNPWRTFKTYIVSLFGVILLQYLSYFTVSDIPIFTLNIAGVIAGGVIAFGDIWNFDAQGGIITNSMFEYYKKIEQREELLIRYQKNYNELIKFKI